MSRFTCRVAFAALMLAGAAQASGLPHESRVPGGIALIEIPGGDVAPTALIDTRRAAVIRHQRPLARHRRHSAIDQARRAVAESRDHDRHARRAVPGHRQALSHATPDDQERAPGEPEARGLETHRGGARAFRRRAVQVYDRRHAGLRAAVAGRRHAIGFLRLAALLQRPAAQSAFGHGYRRGQGHADSLTGFRHGGRGREFLLQRQHAVHRSRLRPGDDVLPPRSDQGESRATSSRPAT